MSSNRTGNKSGNRSKTCLSQLITSSPVTTPDHASQQPTLDSATRSCTKRRRHQIQPRRRRESWLPYMMHLEAAPRRSSNQTRNQRYRRVFSYLDRASYGPTTARTYILLFSPAGTLTTLKRPSFPAFHASFC